ncbi:unnamed protein product [Merluccius merluccius]
MSSSGKSITVIGSGLIGRSWAMVFSSGGYRVRIYDNQPGLAAKAITEIRKQMGELEEASMLRGELSSSDQLALLSSHDDLQQALEGAFFVQVRLWSYATRRGGATPGRAGPRQGGPRVRGVLLNPT